MFISKVSCLRCLKKETVNASCSDHSTQGMVGHATHPSTPEAGRGGRMLHKFKASMVFRGSSKPVRTTQWDSYKHTKKGCQHILKSSLPKQCLLRYWFPSEGKSVIIMQKKNPSYCLILLFCFYLKQKKIIWSVISSWKKYAKGGSFHLLYCCICTNSWSYLIKQHEKQEQTPQNVLFTFYCHW